MSIYVPLSAEVKEALLRLAELEYRNPNRQASLLIREGLERRGLLPPREPLPWKREP